MLPHKRENPCETRLSYQSICLTLVLEMLAVLPFFDYIDLYAPTVTHLKFFLDNNPILKKTVLALKT